MGDLFYRRPLAPERVVCVYHSSRGRTLEWTLYGL